MHSQPRLLFLAVLLMTATCAEGSDTLSGAAAGTGGSAGESNTGGTGGNGGNSNNSSSSVNSSSSAASSGGPMVCPTTYWFFLDGYIDSSSGPFTLTFSLP